MGVNKVSAMLMTEVLPRLQITSADTRVSYANLLSYAQRVYEDLYYSIIAQNPTRYGQIGYAYFYANNVSAQLSANLTDYDNSMNFIKVEFKTNGSTYYPGREIAWTDITDNTAIFSQTAPCFSVYGDLLYMQPVMTANTPSCAKVFYTKRASGLSGGNVTDLPDSMEEVFINGVCRYGFEQLGDTTNSQKFLQEFMAAKEAKLRLLDKRSRTKRNMRDIRDNYFGSY